MDRKISKKALLTTAVPAVILLALALYMASPLRYMAYIERVAGNSSGGRYKLGEGIIKILDGWGGQPLVLLILLGISLFLFARTYRRLKRT